MLSLAMPGNAADSSPGAGEIAIYTEGGGGDAITTADFTHDFDTNDREDGGSFARSGSDITLSRPGHYLAIYNSRFDANAETGAEQRVEVQSHLTLDSVALASGWSQGFIRRQQNQRETITSGMAIFNANALDVLQLHSFRTDITTFGTTTRIGNATGLQLVKLDDVNMSFARLSLATTQTGPTTAAQVKVAYDTNDELGAGFTHAAPGDLTLVDGGKYLVIANTYASGPNNRTALVQRLTLDNAEIPGSKTTVYLRGHNGTQFQSTNDGAAAIGMIIDATAGQVLRVEGALDVNRTSNYIGGRCALTVAKISDTAEYIRLGNQTGQNVNAASDTALNFTAVDESSAALSHAGGGTSAVTINTADDYLFFGSVYDDNDQIARAFYNQAWSVDGGAREVIGQSGRYSRNTGGADQFGNTSGFIGSNLAASSTVEMVSSALGNGGVNDANRVYLQGVRVGSLLTLSNFAVDTSLAAVAVTEGGADGSYDLSLRTAPAAGTVVVTVTAVAETEVSTAIGGPFAPVALFSFTDATPQTVFVRAIDDGDVEGSHSSTITHQITATGDPLNYPLTMPIEDVITNVTDNDVVPVVATDDQNEIGTVVLEGGALSVVDNGGGGTTASLLDNDLDGDGNFVSASDTVSANGATVTVLSDGTFTWDSAGSATIDALAAGEQIVDTFSYTVEDSAGNTDSATVSITVEGVNDDPVLVPTSLGSANGSGASSNLLANQSDADTADVLTITNFVDDVSAAGGAVPTDIFDSEFVPLVLTSDQGATVSISASGAFSYDASTSIAILALAPGAQITESFTFDVFDGTATVQTTVTVVSTGTASPTNDYATTDASTLVNVAALSNDFVRAAGAAAPTAGAAMEFLSENPSNTSAAFFNSGTGPGTLVSIPMASPGVGSILDVAPTNPPLGITQVYSLSGVGSGGPHEDADHADFGGLSTQDATFEFFFRPSDQVGREMVWEIGGNGNGTSLSLIDDQLLFTESDGGTPDDGAQVVATLPPGAVAGGDFVHVIGQIDLAGDLATLYVNGIKLTDVGAINTGTGAAADITDWSGTDNGGIGLLQGTPAGSDFPTGFFIPTSGMGRFAGDFAILRIYTRLLTPAEIGANVDSALGVASPAVVGDLTDLAGAGVPSVGTPVGLPSGATVTLLVDGTFDYDPNGAFASLGTGLTARDSFTYTLNSAVNPVVTVNVDITGQNGDPQITISADSGTVDEGVSAGFTISSSAPVSGPVDVTVSFSGSADSPADFTGSLTVQIPDAGSSAPLSLTTVIDSLFEGVENIIVTIDSVTGNAVLGATLAAETAINDLDGEPEFNIEIDPTSHEEGIAAAFLITPSVASQDERSLTVSFSGTAVNGSDFLGLSSATIPAGAATGSISIDLFNDGIVEGTENLTVTIETVDVGTIGAGNAASTDVTDGAGDCLFDATFETVAVVPPNPDPATTGINGPAAANAGTAVGSWTGIPTSSLAGDLPGVYRETTDVKGDGLDNALVVDRPPLGGGVFSAQLSGPADLTGSNTAVISMDLGNRRTENNSLAKSWRITGLDAAGVKSFELYVNSSNNAPNNEQLHHVDSVGTLTPLGNPADFDNTGSTEMEGEQSRLVLSLTPTGYQVGIDRWPIDGVIDTVTGMLAYAGTATQVSRIEFTLSASADTLVSSGILVDEVKVGGTAGNRPPTATLAAVNLADGGSSALPDTGIGTATNLTTLQVDDPDADPGNVSAIFSSNGAAPLTFTATPAGSAFLIGDGSATLTIIGRLADVNATLSAGVTYTTDAATGGNANIAFTISDLGNTGPGGALSLSHDLTFFVNEGPTVVINQDPGQADPTSGGVIDFEVTFSGSVTGFEGADVDTSASSAAGVLGAVVIGGPSVYTVSVTGMTGSGDVVISIPQGAATASVGGALTEASSALDDTVAYVPNLPPSASNVVQSIFYPSSATPVDLADIVVFDANDSVITTAQSPNFDFPAVHPDSLNLTPDPATDAGLAMEVVFVLDPIDLSGTVRIFEIGGTSNGSGIYLIDGVPHFVSKMNTTAGTFPDGLNDTDWSGNGNISVPLAPGIMTDGVVNRIAIIFSRDAIVVSTNGLGSETVALTGRTTQTNWSGDDTIRVGQNVDGGRGGLGNDPSGTFDDVGSFEMVGTVSSARLWHAIDATGYAINATSAPEQVNVTLTLGAPGDGALSAPAGSTFTPGTGVWNAMGTVDEVNAALAGVQFIPNGTSPVTIAVSIDDADEDSSAALAGTITLSSSIVQQWRLDHFGSADNSGPGANLADPNSNTLPNLLEFLYGFDPTVANNSGLDLLVDNPGPGGTITQHGGLTFWADPVSGDVFMRYPRRADFAAAGLDITDQFSRDLAAFEDAAGVPEVIGTGVGDGGVAIEAVQIKLPLVLPVSGGKARFGRTAADLVPAQ